MKKKNIAAVLFWLIILIAAVAFLNALLMPKYMSDVPEGALMAEWYKEEASHDVLFAGDCEVYENFVPNVLWKIFGISSYVRGSAQQLIWQSYYSLEEMLETDSPKVVVFNVLSMKYGTPQSEAYNRLNLDGMKLSKHKINAVNASVTEGESFASYMLPLLRFHDRITELTSDDFKYLFSRDVLSDSGYLMNVGIRPAENVPEGKPLADYSFPDICWDYLDKMRLLCEEKGAELVLIKAPSLYPYWYSEWDEQIREYAEEYNLSYINLLELADEIGIDYTNDTYDNGLHLNLYGAEKLSKYFGQWLKDNFGLSGHKGEEVYEEIWAEKEQVYLERKARLEAERDSE